MSLTDDGLEDDELELGFLTSTPFSSFDTRLLEALASAEDEVMKLTTSEYLKEAVVAATTVRNVVGDADGFVSNHMSTIISNLLVLAAEVVKAPEEFVITCAAALPKAQRLMFLDKAIKELVDHRKALGSLELTHEVRLNIVTETPLGSMET